MPLSLCVCIKHHRIGKSKDIVALGGVMCTGEIQGMLRDVH